MALSVSATAAALAQEAPAPPEDFAGSGRVAGLLWEIAGYLTEDTHLEGREGWRARRVVPLDGGPKATLAMRFGWMDPWPLELEIWLDSDDPAKHGGGPVSAGEAQEGHEGPAVDPDISDRRPFGGEGSTGLDGRYSLDEILERYARGLRGGPKALIGPWEGIGRGMELSESRALYGVRFGSPEVLVVRADPEIWEFAPFFAGEGGKDPSEGARSVRDWARSIPGAALVVNGGMYYADGTAMGMLSRGGEAVEPRRHPKWKGFVSSGAASDGKRQFAVADEELPRAGEDGASWRNVLQSYMALDGMGRVRVATSSRLASRTAVGEDSKGRICVVFAPGATSLRDLALILYDLGIYPAAGLDGGFESQMALRRGGGWSFYQGEYSHNSFGNVWIRHYQPPLNLAAALIPARVAADPDQNRSEPPGSEGLVSEADSSEPEAPRSVVSGPDASE
jgi:hypothetical protein